MEYIFSMNTEILFLVLEYNIVKCERKSDFIIQKRAKKTLSNNSEGTAIVSPIKIIKVTDRCNSSSTSESNPSSIVSNHIDNLLSTKQLEPVQVHSVVSTIGHERQSNKFSSQSVNVKAIIPSSKKIDKSQYITLQSPRKKRDFYGKAITSSSSNNRLSRPMNKTDASLPTKIRPSSTPVCAARLPRTPLPDRPISIPPLRTSN